MPNVNHLNVSGYCFVSLEQLQEKKQHLLEFAQPLDLKGTVLLSSEGVNLFLAGLEDNIDSFLNQLCATLTIECQSLDLKKSYSPSKPFNRLLIKIKKEIISFDAPYDFNYSAPYIEPEELEQLLKEQPENVIMLDTRNDYEVALGKFKNCVDPNIKSFKDFKKTVEELKDQQDKCIVTYCTGGIRCEKAAVYMKKEGFKNVFQLHGGILRYFEKTNAEHWDGECFVFDHRVSLKKDLSMSDKKLCYACRHPLTTEDCQQPSYVKEQSCPYCINKKTGS